MVPAGLCELTDGRCRRIWTCLSRACRPRRASMAYADPAAGRGAQGGRLTQGLHQAGGMCNSFHLLSEVETRNETLPPLLVDFCLRSSDLGRGAGPDSQTVDVLY